MTRVSSVAVAVAAGAPDEDQREGYAMVALAGVTPVRVRGPVQPGDLIVPSGKQDGAGVAVHPMEASPLVAIQAVGQAWQATGDGEGMVQVGVGSPQLSAVLNRLAIELGTLQAQNAALEARIGALEEAVSAGK